MPPPRFIPGPDGPLEVLLETPEGAPRFAAVVAHPHPRYGGTMRNTIVHRTARALREAGAVSLRFNFRGVEASGGQHHGGTGPEGEEGDVAAALDHLEQAWPGLELWGAGFSFGARTVGALARRDPRLLRLVLVALPVDVFDCDDAAGVTQPTLALWGGDDEFGTLASFEQRYPDRAPSLQAQEIPGADHFFRGHTPEVEAAVLAFARRSLELPR